MPFQKCRCLPICEALDSCSNIDTITVNPISLLGDITKVYSDPENHLGVLRETFIFGFQDILDPLHSRREKGGLSTQEFCPSLRGRPGYFKFWARFFAHGGRDLKLGNLSFQVIYTPGLLRLYFETEQGYSSSLNFLITQKSSPVSPKIDFWTIEIEIFLVVLPCIIDDLID